MHAYTSDLNRPFENPSDPSAALFYLFFPADDLPLLDRFLRLRPPAPSVGDTVVLTNGVSLAVGVVRELVAPGAANATLLPPDVAEGVAAAIVSGEGPDEVMEAVEEMVEAYDLRR